MSDTFHKLLFVGVMIAVVTFSRRGMVAEEPLRLTYGGMQPRAVQNLPPIFILENPSKVLGNLESALSEGETIKAFEEALVLSSPSPPPKISLEAHPVSSPLPSPAAPSEGNQKTASS